EADRGIFTPLRRLVPRAAHATGGRAPLRLVPSPGARCLDGGAGAPAVGGNRGAHARDGAERGDLHAHRADLGPRLLRGPGARPLVARPEDLDVKAADVDERRRRDLTAAGLAL